MSDETKTVGSGESQKEAPKKQSIVEYLRTNLLVLFLVAFVLGGAVKVLASQFVTIGYGDYLVEQHGGVDFAVVEEKAKKQKEEEAQQAESGEGGQAVPSIPTGGSC